MVQISGNQRDASTRRPHGHAGRAEPAARRGLGQAGTPGDLSHGVAGLVQGYDVHAVDMVAHGSLLASLGPVEPPQSCRRPASRARRCTFSHQKQFTWPPRNTMRPAPGAFHLETGLVHVLNRVRLIGCDEGLHLSFKTPRPSRAAPEGPWIAPPRAYAGGCGFWGYCNTWFEVVPDKPRTILGQKIPPFKRRY